MQVRLTNDGDVGRDNGPSGNLYVQLIVKEHQHFLREDNDLVYVLPINVVEAALGVEKTVPTLEKDGSSETLKIPHGTQHGTEFRIRGKGIPHLHANRRGDLRVLVDLRVPQSLSPEQRKLMEALARSMDPKAFRDDDSDSDLDQDKGLFGRFKEKIS